MVKPVTSEFGSMDWVLRFTNWTSQVNNLFFLSSFYVFTVVVLKIKTRSARSIVLPMVSC